MGNPACNLHRKWLQLRHILRQPEYHLWYYILWHLGRKCLGKRLLCQCGQHMRCLRCGQSGSFHGCILVDQLRASLAVNAWLGEIAVRREVGGVMRSADFCKRRSWMVPLDGILGSLLVYTYPRSICFIVHIKDTTVAIDSNRFKYPKN